MRRFSSPSLSLFSNCGAGDIGYRRAGFDFKVMAELEKHRLDVCKLNHPTAESVLGDLRETWPQVVKEYRTLCGDERPGLLAACPPCQGMSSAKYDRGLEDDAEAGSSDSRNLLVTVIANVTRDLCPRAVIVENVQAFLTKKIRHPNNGKSISAAKFLINQLRDYTVFPILADLCDYGVPQSRKRTFLTFIRNDESALNWLHKKQLTPYPLPSYAPDYEGQPRTLRQALSSFGLPSLDAKSLAEAKTPVTNSLHFVPVWDSERYAMVETIPVNSGRSAWENDSCRKCGHIMVARSAANCPKCHGPLLRPVVKAKNGKYRLINGFRTSTYSRMHPDRPAATITTASGHVGSNNTIHPWENRLFSTLECALLQTFPRDFQWGDTLEKFGHTKIREMIGEAVPPLFTELHGKVLMALLDDKRPRKLLPADNSRCAKAFEKLGLKRAKVAS